MDFNCFNKRLGKTTWGSITYHKIIIIENDFLILRGSKDIGPYFTFVQTPLSVAHVYNHFYISKFILISWYIYLFFCLNCYPFYSNGLVRMPFTVVRVLFMFYYKHNRNGRRTAIVLSSEMAMSRIDVFLSLSLPLSLKSINVSSRED